MNARHEIPEGDYRVILDLSARGDSLAEAGDFEGAIAAYNEASALVPNPKEDWDATTWLMAALADAYFSSGDMASARDAVEMGLMSPGGFGNPFFHMRYGQILLDEGIEDRAAEELLRAHMLGPDGLLEQQDPRYLAFLKTRARL